MDAREYDLLPGGERYASSPGERLPSYGCEYSQTRGPVVATVLLTHLSMAPISGSQGQALVWNTKVARRFLLECVEQVLPMFRIVAPHDPRPTQCLEQARALIGGTVDLALLSDARRETLEAKKVFGIAASFAVDALVAAADPTPSEGWPGRTAWLCRQAAAEWAAEAIWECYELRSARRTVRCDSFAERLAAVEVEAEAARTHISASTLQWQADLLMRRLGCEAGRTRNARFPRVTTSERQQLQPTPL